MSFTYQNRNYRIKRYPKSENRSLQAWSAADEHILNYLSERAITPESLAIFHDRFGFLTCLLHEQKPWTILSFKSQEKALRRNLESNTIEVDDARLLEPLAELPDSVAWGLIRVPKSLDLFRFYLAQLSKSLNEDGEVICSFMTRHFSAQMLEVAGTYFESVEQSRAWKKSRLLILKGKKEVEEMDPLTQVAFSEDISLQQYPGVFSASKVDPATRLLMDNLRIADTDKCVLDLAAGNGVLAYAIRQASPETEIHVLDDAFLAVESAKLNLTDERTFFYTNDTLDDFENQFFDLIVTNPPFHFEHENNIEVAINLFTESVRCLKTGGHFRLVGNRHLNYKTHLARLFKLVKVIAETPKFIIYECLK